jgi:hypothetical protein
MANGTNRGVKSGHLKVLKPILEEWKEIMADKANWGKEDAPWWYNERPH